eukprot:709548-Pelagomonas_calceolata.AAC.3
MSDSNSLAAKTPCSAAAITPALCVCACARACPCSVVHCIGAGRMNKEDHRDTTLCMCVLCVLQENCWTVCLADGLLLVSILLCSCLPTSGVGKYCMEDSRHIDGEHMRAVGTGW